jgi:hypothetical protein
VIKKPLEFNPVQGPLKPPLCLHGATEAQQYFPKGLRLGGGDMSRGLSSTEQRICRVVFAFLGAMFFAFLLLKTIESLSPSSSLLANQSQPGTANTSTHAKQPSQSAPAPQAARLRTAVAQNVRGNPPAVPSPTLKARSQLRETAAVETGVRFDPQPLQQRSQGTSLVAGRGLLRISSADATAEIPSAESFETPPEGPIVTPTFAFAEPASAPPREKKVLANSLAPGTQNVSGLGGLSSSTEEAGYIQARLRDLGFLTSSVSGASDASLRAAMRDFKVANHLANDEVWDAQTKEKLTSAKALKADQSFIGRWSKEPCGSGGKDNLRLTINARRIRSSAGSVCEFHDFASDHGAWRVRTTCSQGKQHWKADGKLALRENKLIWKSESDVSSYFRCN